MAIVEVTRAFDMSDSSVRVGELTSTTSDAFEITGGDVVARYLGDFTFDDSGVSGVITGYEEITSGVRTVLFDGLAVEAGTLFSEFSGGDLGSVYAAFFSGNDVMAGSGSADNLIGFAGDDRMIGNAGNDRMDGGSGADTAVFSGNQNSYNLVLSPSSVTVEDRRSDGNGTDSLTNIEFLDFDTNLRDEAFSLTSFGGVSGLAARDFETFIELYIAYFNRAPDAVGLNFWGTAFANGVTFEQMASQFVDQPETRAAYPEGTSNTDFVTAVYDNVFGRIPDQEGFAFWVDVLNRSAETGVTRDQFILEVLRGVQDGSADRLYLDSKVDIGAYYAVHRGMSDTDNASAAMALFDGSEASITEAVAAIDGYYQDALDPSSGEFLMQVVGVLDNPFV